MSETTCPCESMIKQGEKIEALTVADEGFRHEIGALERRLDECERESKSIAQLARSVDKLALNMERMLTEQTAQGERLARLESEPAEEFKYYKRLIIGCLISGIVGGGLGALLTLLF